METSNTKMEETKRLPLEKSTKFAETIFYLLLTVRGKAIIKGMRKE